jgi:anti-anti-sigma regulatory factor
MPLSTNATDPAGFAAMGLGEMELQPMKPTWVKPASCHLIRESAAQLVAQIGPLAAQRDVILDLSQVERIDAAGGTALLTLLTGARAAGHNLQVGSASAHVTEVLGLLGLDRVMFLADFAEQAGFNAA